MLCFILIINAEDFGVHERERQAHGERQLPVILITLSIVELNWVACRDEETFIISGPRQRGTRTESSWASTGSRLYDGMDIYGMREIVYIHPELPFPVWDGQKR